MTWSQIVVGITGRVGSGKTALARYLESKGFEYLRYSLVLAEWFKTDPNVKSRLQQVGWGVMAGEGQYELNRRLISKTKGDHNFVVDGLRHPIDYESLKARFSSRFFLIYIDTPPALRYQRLQDRFETFEEFVNADTHPVESHIESLRMNADLTLSGDLPQKELNHKTEEFLQTVFSGDHI